MDAQNRGDFWRILAVAAVVMAPYVPTFFSGFDFHDDGCMVYPASQVHTVGDWLEFVGRKTCHEFHVRGPFRPIVWRHTCATAQLFGENASLHRAAQFGWSYLAVVLWLWLLKELGIGGWGAAAATAVAFWAPFRSEIWMRLGTFAPPYAFLALIAAVRAARCSAVPTSAEHGPGVPQRLPQLTLEARWRSLAWDAVAWSCALAAIGCKNVFAALLPAMLFLRLTSGGPGLGAALRQHWPRVLFLGSAGLFPVIHLVAFKLDPHPKEYQIVGVTWQGVSLWPRALLGAFGFSFLYPALALLGAAIWQAQRRGERVENGAVRTSLAADCQPANVGVAGLLLVLFGVAVYLPTPPAVSGSYTIPAVWGIDLWLALVLQRAFALGDGIWKRAGLAFLAAGLAGILVANLGKDTKHQARAALYWRVVDVVENELPDGSEIAWIGQWFPHADDEIGLGEGTHFRRHLENRGRTSATVSLLEEQKMQDLQTAEFALTGGAKPPPGHWRLLHSFQASFWLGLRSYSCHLWQRTSEARLAAR